MELMVDRGRRVSVDELNTTKLLAHARQQAVQRKLDDILIVDCDAHHYENENWSEILPVHGERRAAPAHDVGARQGPPQHRAEPGRLHPGHGRARDALSDALHRRRPRPAGCATCSSASAGWTR